ncbi:hypothetical protein LINGRAPRIM_LOCUS543 [Linum grandiflorum]
MPLHHHKASQFPAAPSSLPPNHQSYLSSAFTPSQSTSIMELAVANLRLTDDVDLDDIDVTAPGPDYSLCLVGTLLTRHPYNFAAFASRMADLWIPRCGVVIKQLDNKLVLCQF